MAAPAMTEVGGEMSGDKGRCWVNNFARIGDFEAASNNATTCKA